MIFRLSNITVCLALLVIISGCVKQPGMITGTGVDTSKYILYAEDVNTKTVTDVSFNVNWTDTDNLAVYTWPAGAALPTDAAVWRSANPVNFVAEAGNVSPKPFKLSPTDDEHSLGDPETYADRLNAFKTRFGEGTTDLNWGVIYPGKMANASKPGMGIVVFGDKEMVRSRQEGNDNMSHLAFQDVLWGKATGTAPTVQMKHLGTMMVYTVSNATSVEFTVTSIKITVNGANIGGQFRFNVFEGTFDSCMSALHECTLWVNNASAIPAGGSAKFYQVLAPFSLNAGNKITMTVVTDKGTWSKEMTLSAAKSFESGKINSANLPVDVGPATHSVEIRNNALFVDGERFFIKGAATDGLNLDGSGKQLFWEDAMMAGANLVRIYSGNSGYKALLDKMAEKGMFVCFGLNLQRQCNGFDYNDTAARQNQIALLKNIINNLKGHPAILMWCIGNELEGEVDNVNKNVWDDVNEISRYIHEQDGRPTTVAICWPWGVMNDIITRVPDIDLLCINQYDPEIYDVHNVVTGSGFTKPYVISEFGPRGTWDSSIPKTDWGGLIEKTGSQKAEEYRQIYNSCILSHKDEGCIGSIVFLWGYQSHGAVLTWYAMYDQFTKYSLPSVDMMKKLWTGNDFPNRAPVISTNSMTLNGKHPADNVKVDRGSWNDARIIATDPEGDPLSYSWRIVEDKRLPAGTFMPDNRVTLMGEAGSSIRFKAPERSGQYRLVVWAKDDAHCKTDVASFPFYVQNNTASVYEEIDGWTDGNDIIF